uniref:Uncharacterized protein n=1 Tax=Rhizophora mucronata TaxID=61149 RepID=A0A2P2Q6J7_RHIMU
MDGSMCQKGLIFYRDVIFLVNTHHHISLAIQRYYLHKLYLTLPIPQEGVEGLDGEAVISECIYEG